MSARLGERLPRALREVADQATRHHTPTLAAGLAFFGIVSIGPALAVAFATFRIATSPDTASSAVDLLKDAFSQTLRLSALMAQMQEKAGDYLGVGLLVLLWPATTLASGWKRGLDAVEEADSAGGVRGLRGRAKGLGLGALLLAGMLMLVVATTVGAAFAGAGRVAVLAGVGAAAVALQYGFCLLVYRVLPSTRHPWRTLWPGALWATAGVSLATLVLALALTTAEGLASRYPPSLATAVLLGLWLYGANLSLLLGAEYNAQRRARRAG